MCDLTGSRARGCVCGYVRGIAVCVALSAAVRAAVHTAACSAASFATYRAVCAVNNSVWARGFGGRGLGQNVMSPDSTVMDSDNNVNVPVNMTP